ncbi:MAG: citramalate synthase [Candidatus Bipolaricaulia bacterium]
MNGSTVEENRVLIYDTTLRDGSQGRGIYFTLEDKLKIAQQLDAFSIDYIEGGWPGSNPKDISFFQRARDLKLKHAKVTAFGSTRRAGVAVDEDPNLRELVWARVPVATIFGKSWKLHVYDVIGTTLEENLAMIEESVAYLKEQGMEIIYDAEHFFDGYKDNPEYALETLQAAVRSGADWVCLCDTNGGTLTRELGEIVAAVVDRIDIPLGIHTHNDSGLAVANTLEAVACGARHVQGTINGYGERTGNADLCSIIPNLILKMGMHCLGGDGRAQLQHLTDLSRYVSELANLAHDERLPFVGESSFSHKGGMHVDAMMKNARSFEHVSPEAVGNTRRFLISELSGKGNILQKAEEYGVKLSKKSPETAAVLAQLKELENQGYQFEDANASFELLLRRAQGESPNFFQLLNYRVFVERFEDGGTFAEAAVKIQVDGEQLLMAGEGDGPVHALDNALRQALMNFYPEIGRMKLRDYKVRILEREKGTGAKPRVIIETSDGSTSWSTVGVSHDIIEASWKALVDSYVYGLWKARARQALENEDG